MAKYNSVCIIPNQQRQSHLHRSTNEADAKLNEWSYRPQGFQVLCHMYWQNYRCETLEECDKTSKKDAIGVTTDLSKVIVHLK